MMLFSPPSGPLSPSPDQSSTGSAIKCLLSYAEELGDCLIDVEITDDTILLSGHAPSEAAVVRAIEIVTAFTSRRVVCGVVVVRETSL